MNEFISYLWRTGGDTLKIAHSRGEQLRSFCDADWNITACHQSTTGWIIFHGNNPISCTARLTGESECISLSSMSQEVIWLKMLLESMGEQPGVVEIGSNDGTPEDPGCVHIWWDNEKSEQVPALHSDSSNAIQNMHKHWVSPRLWHIKTAYHFFKQYVLSGDVKLSHVSGTQNVANILTKGFGTCGPHQSNQKGPDFREKALEALGHMKCEDNCTCKRRSSNTSTESQESVSKKCAALKNNGKLDAPAVSKKARISVDFFRQPGITDTAAAAALQKLDDEEEEIAQK